MPTRLCLHSRSMVYARGQRRRGAVDAECLGRMEALLENATADSILNGEMAEDAMLPEGIEDSEAQAILAGCGLMELMMARMAESGAMQIMMEQ